MPLAFALSPLLVVAVGAMLLMLAEAFSTTRTPIALGGPLRTVEHANGLALPTIHSVKAVAPAGCNPAAPLV